MADRLLEQDVKVKAEFEEKLATNRAFANDPDARLA